MHVTLTRLSTTIVIVKYLTGDFRTKTYLQPSKDNNLKNSFQRALLSNVCSLNPQYLEVHQIEVVALLSIVQRGLSKLKLLTDEAGACIPI